MTVLVSPGLRARQAQDRPKLGLTRRQAELLVFICGFQRAKGYTPSYDEMARGLGCASKGRISEMLSSLEERGVILHLQNRARAIEVLVAPPTVSQAPDGAPLYFVPVPRQAQDARELRR